MSEDFKTAFVMELERRAEAKVEMASLEKEPLVGCPDSVAGNLQVNRYCRLQPLQYMKYDGEKVVSYQLCPPRCYIENWQRCPLR